MAEIKFSYEETSSFCSSLVYLIHSGISTGDAFSLIASDEKNSSIKEKIKTMADEADNGIMISQSFKNSGCFEPYISEMIAAGECTGRLEESLEAVSTSCAKRAYLDLQLKNALLYPCILLLIMLAVIVVMLVYVLPVFDSVYSQLGAGLSGFAGSLLSFGKVLKNIMPAVIVLFGLGVVFLVAFSMFDSFRSIVLKKIWGIRGDRGVSGQINISRFARGLAMSIGSGLNIEEAIRIASSLPDSDSDIKERADRCLKHISAGDSLAVALKNAELMPGGECWILEAGIKGGNSDRAMNQIASRLEMKADDALAKSVSRIEPLIVVICAILTGIILLSVMLPLVNIMGVIG